jgi:hypothetical protein
MWKHVLEGDSGLFPEQLTAFEWIRLSWRGILLEVGVVFALLATASWLVRG